MFALSRLLACWIRLLKLMPTPPTFGGDQFTRLRVEVRLGVHVLYSSHTLHLWSAYGLRFCTACGRFATTDGRELAGLRPGETSKKSNKKLQRNQRGLFPSHRGPPVAAREARAAQAASSFGALRSESDDQPLWFEDELLVSAALEWPLPR